MGVESARRAATWGGIPMKHISLAALTIQNAGLILIMHYSRIMPVADGHRYFTSTAVFFNEVIKLGFSLTMALYEVSQNIPTSAPVTQMCAVLWAAVFGGDSWKLAIPALLYTLQNSLQYVAVSNLDAATFQVTYQLKILTTAMFSVLLLRRSLSGRKWLALVLLMIGVGICQLPSGTGQGTLESLKAARFSLPRSVEELRELGSSTAEELLRRGKGILPRSATYEGIKEDVAALQHPPMNTSLGLMAVIAACSISGLAGVYFEKVLKDKKDDKSLWVRNVQLSFYSLFPAFFLGVLFKDGEEISKYGFFVGYNWVVWTAILFQAFGGIIVALVVNYADNIAKNFATSISIIISFFASVMFFDLKIVANSVIGTIIVLYATYLYSSRERSRPPPLRVTNLDNSAMDNPEYIEVDRTPSDVRAKSPNPFRVIEALTTSSRPGTPVGERHHFRTNSERKQFGKRED